MKWKRFRRHVMGACLLVLALFSPRDARAGEDAPSVFTKEWIRWGNGLKTEYLVFNALSTNPAANLELTKNPLTSQSFQDVEELNMALYDPAARIFMHYLVTCALGPDQEVSWSPKLTDEPEQVWHGGGGICREWYDHSPSLECLERVSACILSRNNPAGALVRILLQGGGQDDPPETLKPMSTVPPDTFEHSRMQNNGVLRQARPITSFQPCDASSVNGDCGWRPLVVGTCTPGASVNLIAQAASPGTCGSLRVCQGSQGCMSGDTNVIAENSDSCGTSALGFICPGKGTFSAMSLSTLIGVAGVQGDDWESVEVGGGDAKILGENDHFPLREGAFYGNLFGPNAIMPGLSVRFDPETQETKLRLQVGEATVEYTRQVGGWCMKPLDPHDPCIPSIPMVSGRPVYNDLYVCSAPGWTGDEEDLPGRVCALPDSKANCAAHRVGSCVSFPGGKCTETGGVFDQCDGSTKTWMHPITTFMSDMSE